MNGVNASTEDDDDANTIAAVTIAPTDDDVENIMMVVVVDVNYFHEKGISLRKGIDSSNRSSIYDTLFLPESSVAEVFV